MNEGTYKAEPPEIVDVTTLSPNGRTNIPADIIRFLKLTNKVLWVKDGSKIYIENPKK